MRIAVDAMGGDYAPAEIVKGSVNIARTNDEAEIVLVGDEAALNAELALCGEIPSNLTIKHAPERIEMDEHPAQAARKKRQSSMVVAGLMVACGEADATISAGNTGAAMAIATLDIGLVPGADRPAIATEIPTIKGKALLLDAGANVDISPQQILKFALLGSLYSEKVLKNPNPRVGLLNIGSEPGKGNELTRNAYPLLEQSGLNFIGNVEGGDLFDHVADVVVCDGFAGNVLLKSVEGMAEMILETFWVEADKLNPSQETKDVLSEALRAIALRIDYAETGGAPLLGVKGVSIIAHGRSKARAIENAILLAIKAVEGGYVAALEAKLSSEVSQ
jgi:phosphate acyltransferase